jgi:urea transport system ATP-binding protein
MLTVKDLSFHYGKSQILYDINLTARKGQVTCVMGTNGVGKTTLMRAIAGVTHASRGAIHLDDQNITAMAAHQRAILGVAYVPQGRGIFPLLSVKENLETGFQMFPILEKMLYRKGGDLSGGQQQQLAIARALITQPQVLILDEPTEGIQPNIIKDIGAVIRNLQSRGDMAIILVEQYFDFAFDLADHFYALRRGEIVLDQPKVSVTREQVLGCVSV